MLALSQFIPPKVQMIHQTISFSHFTNNVIRFFQDIDNPAVLT
jgi:hypothetical protein